MLLELAVRDLGVIPELRLVLGMGMTALTGETGAGKTLVVEALDLLLGGRADGTLVRGGAAEARVEGRFETDGQELVLARVVPAQGRSRAYLNGRMATAGELAEVGRTLVDLHGQHAHQSLLAPSVQRDALDRFAGIDLQPLTAARQRLAEVDRQLTGLGGDSGARAREVDLLRFQLDELEAARLEDPEEDEALDAEEDELAGAVAHRQAAMVAAELLSADGPVADGLGRARAALGERRPFAELVQRLQGLEVEFTDVAAEVRLTSESVEERPERLAEIRVRRQLLRDLVHKYGSASIEDPSPVGPASLANVMAYAAQVDERLENLASHDARVAGLESERSAAAAALKDAEQRIGAARRAAAPALAGAVQDHLRELAMDEARIGVSVGPGSGDQVTILLAANPGTDPLPLARVASGGELARAMLAVRLVLTAGPPVLVFDEVDAGIGGEAALAVGRALARVSADHQVLVVTHLAQVAASADAQAVVTKLQAGGQTSSQVELVTGEARVVELSRMLSGSPGSGPAREHAGELLHAADQERHRRRRDVRAGNQHPTKVREGV